MRHHYAIGILLAGLTFARSAQLSAQDSGPGNQAVLFIREGETVYDVVNHVTWLGDANLAGKTLPDVTLAITPATVCLLVGNTADMLSPGTCTITAYQAGNDLDAPASLTRSFTVTAP